jgi:hypothetical protein
MYCILEGQDAVTDVFILFEFFTSKFPFPKKICRICDTAVCAWMAVFWVFVPSADFWLKTNVLEEDTASIFRAKNGSSFSPQNGIITAFSYRGENLKT